MTRQRGRGRPPKSSYKNPNLQSPVNDLHSTVGYFPRHIPRKSRTGTKTSIAVKTWPRSGSEEVETLPLRVVEKESSLPQWITKKKSTNPKSNEESRNIRTSNNESGPCSLSESSLVPWMAEIVIPGPIPDFDSSDEVSFLNDFFVDIPED